ncbi:MAG: hypothetical protein Unbinned3205contig1001_47 [Prokaryotic dsDNA virus sp.]|nr:MAG: hypothetical protein Unbinned3205contig1001_47 [Prokaryotic dsDNA virus sp.]|tara:strand:+ start:5918 stop:9949 length:4032 start_codon:yes stop_codon:yes gene_type:complete
MATQLRLIGQTAKNQAPKILYIDLSDDQPITANFQFKDVQDFSTNKGNFTYSFRIPSTPNNNQVFNQYYSVTQIGNFNVTAKLEATILKNNIDVFSGFLQLTNVICSQGEIYSYECVVFSSVSNIGQVLESKLMSDLDWSAYNHEQSATIIYESMNRDVTPLLNGDIVYSLWDYGLNWTGSNNGASVQNPANPIDLRTCRPQIRAKAVLNTIFEQSGFNLISTIFDTGGRLADLYVELNCGGVNVKTTLDEQFYNTNVSLLNSTVLLFSDTNEYKTIVFDSDSNDLLNSNASGNYNTSTGVYDASSNQLWSQQFIRLHTGITTANMVGATIQLVFFDVTDNIAVMEDEPITITTDGSFNLVVEAITITLNLSHTFEARFLVTNISNPSNAFLNVINQSVGTALPSFLSIEPNNGINFDTPSQPTITPFTPTNPIVNVGKNWTKIKAIDFLTSLAKKFNLVIIPDKNVASTIYIYTYDEWIDAGISKDWTEKVDRSKDIQYKPTAELQAKVVTFSDKKSDDAYNSLFFNSQDRVYGTQLVDNTSNDFGKEKLEVKTEFTPTITTNPDGIPNAYVRCYKDDFTNPASLRLAFYNGVTSAVNFSIYGTDNPLNPSATIAMTATSRLTNYSGSLTNSQAVSTYSLSFMPEVNIWATQPTPLNGVYREYYYRFFRETYSQDSRLVTATLFLTTSDIQNLELNNIIFLDNTYYRINNIKNYSLVGDASCQVELIKIEQTFLQESTSGLECNLDVGTISLSGQVNFFVNGTTTPATATETCCNVNNYTWNPTTNTCRMIVSTGFEPYEIPETETIKIPSLVYGGNNVNDDGNVVVGTGNVTTGGTIIIGDHNNIAIGSLDATIKGDLNTIDSGVEQVGISGSNNEVIPYKFDALFRSNLFPIRQKIINTNLEGDYGRPLCTGDNFISTGADKLYNAIGRGGAGHFVKQFTSNGKQEFVVGINGRYELGSGVNEITNRGNNAFRMDYPSSIYVEIKVFGQERGTIQNRSQEFSYRRYTGIIQHTSNSPSPLVNVKQESGDTNESTIFAPYNFNVVPQYSIRVDNGTANDGMFNFQVDTNATNLGIVDFTIEFNYTLVGLQNMSRTSGVPIFSPTSINGCLLWCDASNYSSITFAGSSTTDVQVWNDLSGNNHHMVNMVSNNYPLYQEDSSTLMPYMSFNGSNKAFTNNDSSLYNCNQSDNTIFVVFEADDTATTLEGKFIAGSCRFDRQKQGINISATGTSGGGTNATAYTNDNANLSAFLNTIPVTQRQVVHGTRKVTIQQVTDQNGNTNSNTSAQNQTVDHYNIGGATYRGNLKGFLNGKVYEVIQYDSWLDDSEVSQVMNYLTTKWTT